MLTPPPRKIDELDDLIEKAVRIVIQYNFASASLLQRRLSIGYAKAARLMDELQSLNIVGEADGAKPRKVLVKKFEDYLKLKKTTPKEPQEDIFATPANYTIPSKDTVAMIKNNLWNPQFGEILEFIKTDSYRHELPIIFGRDEKGEILIENFGDVWNLIITGNPISKKESFVDTLLLTQLLLHSPKTFRLIINDSTYYFDLYEGIPHLLCPVRNNFDKSSTFRWAVSEADRRLKACTINNVRSVKENEQLLEEFPIILIVTVIDYRDIQLEELIVRLTQLGERAQIYNVILTHRFNDANLSSEVKSNIPNRLVFRLSSKRDSKVAGVKGVDELHQGSFIYRKSDSDQKRFVSVFTPESELKKVLEKIKNQ